jgi:phosphoribosylanthranilate isomerase
MIPPPVTPSEYWPLSLRVKICGITKIDQGCEIAALGAHALGFICVPQSPRFVTPEQIRQITKQLPAQTLDRVPLARIGIFANTTVAHIQAVVETGQLTSIQLHGSESVAFCQQVRMVLPQIELIKAFRLKTIETLIQIAPYQETVDSLLLDAYTPKALGGTGETWDWSIVSNFSPQRPWFLAGGLTPDNVVQALSQTHPSGIDLSSGVEQAPGDKDLQQVKRLFQMLSA